MPVEIGRAGRTPGQSFCLTDGDERDARLWEISENLHRAELSAVERAEHIDEWRRLTVETFCPQHVGKGSGRRDHDRGHEKTAGALGVSHETVRRAERIASLPADIREQARNEDWSQSRLLDEARARDPVRPVPPPPPVRNDAEAEDAWLSAILRIWNKAPREWRRLMASKTQPASNPQGGRPSKGHHEGATTCGT